MTNGEDILTVTGLNVSYGESRVLFDVDLNVRSGQVVACVGRNGAGQNHPAQEHCRIPKADLGIDHLQRYRPDWPGGPTTSPKWGSNTFPRTKKCFRI